MVGVPVTMKRACNPLPATCAVPAAGFVRAAACGTPYVGPAFGVNEGGPGEVARVIAVVTDNGRLSVRVVGVVVLSGITGPEWGGKG